MDRVADSGSDRTAMERFGGAGLALLPWTRHMLAVLWEQVRLLLQVIYYTFVNVFQMFRFEVHVRITDESGQHIQHMSAASNPSDSFLFSSLFDGDGGVMVGSSGQLSNFCSEVGDPFGAEALLSSLRAEELCCGLVDDLVSRTSGREDGLFVGQAGWKMGFPGDWSIFASSSDDSSCGGGRHWSSERPSSWEGSPQWSSEDDQNPVEFDSEESRALWESLSTSSDPYNPLFFSACFTTSSNTGKEELSEPELSEPDLGAAGPSDEERPVNVWVSRSDSEVSWSGSDSSGLNVDEESEKLLELFGSTDPYNPLCFTASTSTGAEHQPRPLLENADQTAEGSDNFLPSSDHRDEEERLWNSLRRHDDPYHPLNFRALLHTPPSTMTALPLTPSADPAHNRGGKPRARKPRLPARRPMKHSHPDQSLVPWKKPGPPEKKTGSVHKQVRFSPIVHVHVMRSWSFACQAARRGSWEEMARDRERFRRRIQEAEQSIGPYLSSAHRRRMQTHQDAVEFVDMLPV